MIRLNLLKDLAGVDLRPAKTLAIKILAAGLFIQTIVYWNLSSESQKKKDAVTLLKKQITVMEERKKEFLAATPPEKISGAVQERNEWFKERGRIPIFILARLEKDMPPTVELKTFESDGSGGNLQLVAPDMDAATHYLNGVLGTKNVRITMVDRVPTGILAACTWNE